MITNADVIKHLEELVENKKIEYMLAENKIFNAVSMLVVPDTFRKDNEHMLSISRAICNYESVIELLRKEKF